MEKVYFGKNEMIRFLSQLEGVEFFGVELDKKEKVVDDEYRQVVVTTKGATLTPIQEFAPHCVLKRDETQYAVALYSVHSLGPIPSYPGDRRNSYDDLYFRVERISESEHHLWKPRRQRNPRYGVDPRNATIPNGFEVPREHVDASLRYGPGFQPHQNELVIEGEDPLFDLVLEAMKDETKMRSPNRIAEVRRGRGYNYSPQYIVGEVGVFNPAP